MIQPAPTNGKASPLRYNVKRRLAELLEDEKNEILKTVRVECMISRSTMSRYLNEKKSANAIMPAVVLKSFAAAFGVHMEDLLNK